MKSHEQEEFAITDMYLEYLRGEGSWERLRSAAEVYCYRIALHCFGSRDELLTPFVNTVFEKIPCLITHFQYRGTPIEYYLSRTISLRCKAIICRDARKRERERICRCCSYAVCEQELAGASTAAEEAVCREVPAMKKGAAEFFGADPSGFIPGRAARKRLLCLALREAERVDDDLINAIAPAIGADPEWLTDIVTGLRRDTESRKTRFRALTERRNKLFGRMLECQARLQSCADPREIPELREQAALLRQRLDKADGEIRRKQWHPTQTEIAGALGTSKGTIGSAIHYLNSHTLERALLDETEEEPDHAA